jgi:hypothetical protein
LPDPYLRGINSPLFVRPSLSFRLLSSKQFRKCIRRGRSEPQIFSPALSSDCLAIDFPRRAIAQARAFGFAIPLFRGVAKAALDCAHRTSTFLSCAFCEQEGHLAAPSPLSLFAMFGWCVNSAHQGLFCKRPWRPCS